jgi:hypothetical protein
LFSIHIRHVVRARDINAPLPGSITALNPIGTRPLGNIGEIYQYESSGKFDQNQFFVAINNRFSRTISFFSSYSLSKTQNDTDGQGGGLFPANSWDLSGEYGRAAFDVRHRFTFAGTITLPWQQISLNPFIMVTSGRPFNITTGQDTNLDRQFTERPSFAPAGADCNDPNIACTAFGNFNRNPAPGEPLIPRNYGEGPGFFSVNMRISKTWSFGSTGASAANRNNQNQQQGQAGGRGGRGGGGGAGAGGNQVRVPGGGGGGPAMGMGGQRGGPGGGIPGLGGGGAAEGKRYSMQLSLNFSNLFNHVNLSTPVGSLSSPSFGESLGLGGGFGGFGGPGGGGFGGSGGAGNRRVTAQLRFSF